MEQFCFPQKPETQNASVVVPGMAIPAQAHAFVAIIYQKQLLYDAALVHLLHVGLIAAFAFDMQNYAQFINAAKHAFSSPLPSTHHQAHCISHFPFSMFTFMGTPFSAHPNSNIVFRHLGKRLQ